MWFFTLKNMDDELMIDRIATFRTRDVEVKAVKVVELETWDS